MNPSIRTKLKLLLGCVIITAACFAVYTPAIKGGFIWDDDSYVTNNPLIPASDGLWRIWFSTESPSQYFPLTYTTFWFEYRLWGFNPVPYHVANVSIHVISSLLLWFILRRLLVPAAFVAAAVFALHPVNVESVAWITERKNVLMLFFSLLSVFFWIEFTLRTQTTRKAAVFFVLSLLCYMLSLLSKTTACILPFVLILVLWLKGSPLNKRRLFQIAPFFVIGIAMGLLIMWWENHHQGTSLVNLGLFPLQRLLIAARAVWFYAGKIFYPINLAFSYPRWNIDSADPSQYFWPLACLLTAAGLWFWRKSLGRGPIVAVLIFVATLFPMLGFFDLYTFVYTWVADHYQYMASIAIITLAVAACSRLLTRFGDTIARLAPLFAGVLLLACAALTWRQAGIYTNLETLWRDTVKKNPGSWLAHNNLGQILYAQGKIDELIYHLNRAIDCAKNTPALHSYSIASTHCNLALAYQSQGKYKDAIDQFRIALDIFPNDPQSHFIFADLLESQGQLDEAVTQFNQALQITPYDATLHYRLAGVLLKKGDISNAIIHLRRALDIKPDYIDALNELVGLSVKGTATPGSKDVIEYASRATKLTNRQNPVILNILAVALASDGRFAEAAETGEEALNLAVHAGANDLADLIRTQLKSYKEQLK